MAHEFANTQDLVEIEEIRDSTVVLKSGELRKIVMVVGTNFSLKSEAEQNIITAAYQNFLNSIDFPLQIIIHSRKINIDEYLKKIETYQSQEPSALLQNQIGEYREFIRGFVAQNAIMEKNFFVVVPFAPVAILPMKRSSFLGSLPFFGGKKTTEEEEKTHEAEEAEFKQNLAQLDQRVGQVIEGIAGIGLEASALSREELVELFYNFYNPETVEKTHIPLPEEPQTSS